MRQVLPVCTVPITTSKLFIVTHTKKHKSAYAIEKFVLYFIAIRWLLLPDYIFFKLCQTAQVVWTVNRNNTIAHPPTQQCHQIIDHWTVSAVGYSLSDCLGVELCSYKKKNRRMRRWWTANAAFQAIQNLLLLLHHSSSIWGEGWILYSFELTNACNMTKVKTKYYVQIIFIIQKRVVIHLWRLQCFLPLKNNLRHPDFTLKFLPISLICWGFIDLFLGHDFVTGQKYYDQMERDERQTSSLLYHTGM